MFIRKRLTSLSGFSSQKGSNIVGEILNMPSYQSSLGFVRLSCRCRSGCSHLFQKFCFCYASSFGLDYDKMKKMHICCISSIILLKIAFHYMYYDLTLFLYYSIVSILYSMLTRQYTNAKWLLPGGRGCFKQSYTCNNKDDVSDGLLITFSLCWCKTFLWSC